METLEEEIVSLKDMYIKRIDVDEELSDSSGDTQVILDLDATGPSSDRISQEKSREQPRQMGQS